MDYIYGIILIIASSFLYEKYKKEQLKYDENAHYDLIRKYLLEGERGRQEIGGIWITKQEFLNKYSENVIN